MKAKDMSDVINGANDRIYEEGRKAGIREALDNALPVTLEDIKKAGIREVVDAIVKDTRNFEVPLSLGLIAKLKDWGVNDGTLARS